MPLSLNSFIVYISDVYPVVARLLRVMEKFDGNSSMPNILKASRAVMEKRKKELENGSANVRIRCEHEYCIRHHHLYAYTDKLH